MLACRVTGHRYRFEADGSVMRWSCQRGCGAGGAKAYGAPADAVRYARAFDRDDVGTLGRRAPLFGLFPLRLVWWLRRRRESRRDPS